MILFKCDTHEAYLRGPPLISTQLCLSTVNWSGLGLGSSRIKICIVLLVFMGDDFPIIRDIDQFRFLMNIMEHIDFFNLPLVISERYVSNLLYVDGSVEEGNRLDRVGRSRVLCFFLSSYVSCIGDGVSTEEWKALGRLSRSMIEKTQWIIIVVRKWRCRVLRACVIPIHLRM